MLTKKKKFSRKEIKEDKLVEFYYKLQSFISENKNKVLTYSFALAAVVVAVIFYVNYQSTQNEEAGAHLARAMDFYDSGSYLEAIEGKQGSDIMGLKKLVAEYGSTENGETAKIYLANSYANLGQTEEAFKYFEDYGGDVDIYKAASLAGQASYYSYKGDFEKAANLYLKASRVDKNNVINPDYMFQASINFLNAGNKDQAKDLLQTIKDDYKTSAAFSQVDRYLSQVN
jgi:tetratricopeptide (TPR) repeat protein